jgi:hypothetical protein
MYLALLPFLFVTPPNQELLKLPVEVIVFLPMDATNKDRALAQNARTALARLRPQNPGRQKTFARGFIGEAKPVQPPHTVIKRQGWGVIIRKVTPTKSGWRAEVRVCLRAVNLNGAMLHIIPSHHEVYVCKDGKVTLEKENVDPKWKPEYGLAGATM